MACPECEKNKKKTAKDFTKAVVEIKNPDKLVLFRKVVVPASMGTEEQFPASVGKFSNVLLQYEANGDTYLYSSDGIPTQLSSDVSELQRQLDELKIVVTNEIADRIAADGTINGRIDQEILDRQAADNDLSAALAAEVAARKAADNTLDGKITAEKNARIAADNTLQTNINNEATARAAADSTLDGKIAAEKEAREAADNTLDGKITAEATTRANADTALGTRITNETTARQNADNTLDGKITTEANTRSAADSALAEDISAEVTRAKAAETALGGRIDDEATARAAADTTLDGKITAEATARANADSTLDGKITDEATTRANADTALGTRITNETTARTDADTAINNKLNRTVLYDLEMQTDANNVTFVEDKVNLGTGATTTERDVIPAASRTTAGTISASEYISLVDAEEKITALLEGAVAIDNLPANPTQQQLTDAWLAATGKTELINRASIYDSANQLVHTYYTNVSEWEDSPAGAQITIDQFTNSAAGIIKGSTTDGNVSANLDGTGTVSGWTALKNTVAAKANSSDLATVATSGSYNDLSNKPTIPTVNDATLTIQKNGTTVKTFTANASTNVTANITVPTKTSDITNDSNYVSDASYVHTDNNFTTALKNKLDGIATGAEVNQNAFSNVKVGGTTVAADTKTDTLELVAGSNVTLTPDATNDKVTIAATDTNTTYTFANGTNGFTVTPSGGSAQTVTVTPSIANATTSTAGLMSAADKTKLNGIATGAEVNVQSDWSQTDTTADDYIKNKPTIPTVNNATLTIQKNGTDVQTFTANSSTNKTANITVPTKVTDLTDAANYVAKDGDFYVTGEGSNFSMTGTSQNVYADLKVKGDTQQTTYSGKNLLKMSGFVNTTAGLTGTVTDGSVITVAGTTGTNLSSNKVGELAQQIPAGTYTLTIDHASTHIINLSVNSNEGTVAFRLAAGETSITKTLTSASTGGTVYWGIEVNTTYNETFKFQLVAGSTPDYDFEPYVGGVAAPNPDYPQEVEVVTGRQVISSCGKNVLGSEWEVGQYNNGDGSKSDNANMVRTKSFVNVSPNTQYILSRDGSGIAMNVLEYDKDQKFLRVNSGASIAANHAFTTGSDVEYLTLWRGSSGGTAKMQMEKGSTITAYYAYTGGDFEVNLGKNLFDKDNASQLVDGQITSSLGFDSTAGKTLYIRCLPNTTYSIQKTFSQRGRVGSSSVYVPTSGSLTKCMTMSHVSADNSYKATITTGDNDTYLWVTYGTSDDDLQEVLDTIQIEKGSTVTSYAPYFTPIELCLIGNYRDYIYRNNDKWYLHKTIGKEYFSSISDYSFNNGCFQSSAKFPNNKVAQTFSFSKMFTYNPVQSSITTVLVNGEFGWNTNNLFTAKYTALTSKAQWTTWLTQNDPSFYYVLSTPTDTEITNPLLVAQLDDLWRNLQSGTNTTNVNVEGDLPAILGVTAFTNTLASAMAGINERMNRLPAIPEITMTTTDPGEGQTLADNHYVAVYQ